MNDTLFNSYSKLIPPLRRDIQQIPIHQNGNVFTYFYDSLGYATPDFAIPSDSKAILSLIDGNRSVDDILKFSANGVTKEQILGYVRFLDEHGVLESQYFKEQADLIETEYEKSGIHNCTTAGISYPTNPLELKELLDTAFSGSEHSDPVAKAKALYAPHIDPRVGMNSYVKSFSAIRNLKPKRVVILATSHYSGLYHPIYQELPFVLSGKTFSMPNGSVSSDTLSIDVIMNSFPDPLQAGATRQDRAHRVEHSIELHLLFLNYIWNHDFEIVPILVGGFDEIYYSSGSYREQQVDTFTTTLRNEFNNEDTFFLISGDLSHFGHKFGDPKPASSMFDEVQLNDKRFLDTSSKGDVDKLLSLMKEEYDPYRICGFPPLFTYLKTFPDSKGTILSFDLWDEREQESAVSFGSILYS